MRTRVRQVALAAGALAVAALVATIADTHTQVEAWSLGTAYSAFLLLAVSMVLGPLNVLRRKHNPVHSAVRRDVGIAAGIASLVHTALGLQVHMGGVLAKYFIPPPNAKLAGWSFVAGNWIGLISAIVLATLVTISNNAGVRSLGLPRWKRIQRTAYIAAGAAVIHGIIYQMLEKRNAAMIAFVILSAGVVIGLQLKGLAARRAVSESAASHGDQR